MPELVGVLVFKLYLHVPDLHSQALCFSSSDISLVARRHRSEKALLHFDCH